MTAVHLHGPIVGCQRPGARAHRVGVQVGLQPAQQRVGRFYGTEVRVCHGLGRQPACSSRRSRPRVASSGCPTCWWLTSSTPRALAAYARRAPARVRRWDAAATGAAHDASTGRRATRCRWRANRVCPNSDSRGGSPIADSRSSATVLRCRTCGGSAADPGDQGPPESGLPGQIGIQRVAGAVGRPPADQSASSCGRCERRTRTGRRCGAPPRIAGRGAVRPRSPVSQWPRCAASVRHQGSSRLRRSPRAAATSWRPATTGRRRWFR